MLKLHYAMPFSVEPLLVYINARLITSVTQYYSPPCLRCRLKRCSRHRQKPCEAPMAFSPAHLFEELPPRHHGLRSRLAH